MKIDLRDRCARPKCNKLICASKIAQRKWKQYRPYCSYQCQEFHNLEKAQVYINGMISRADRKEAK